MDSPVTFQLSASAGLEADGYGGVRIVRDHTVIRLTPVETAQLRTALAALLVWERTAAPGEEE